MTWHAFVVDAYRSMRDAQLQRAEQWAMGYDTETELFFSEMETRVTFKSVLESAKGWNSNV